MVALVRKGGDTTTRTEIETAFAKDNKVKENDNFRTTDSSEFYAVDSALFGLESDLLSVKTFPVLLH